MQTMTDKVSPDLIEYLISAKTGFPDVPETSVTSPLMELFVSADRGQLSQSITERKCPRGEVVFHEGEEGDTMYLIYSGQVAIVKGDLNSPTILAYRKTGEIFGEMALLENQPRSASIIALENSHLIGLNRTQFEQLLHTAPSISRSIMEVLSASLRRMSEARSTGELSEKRLSQQVSILQDEKHRLEEIQRLHQETTELIIHDLRNPLNAISISLKMLSLMLPEDVLKANYEVLSVASASAQRLQRLVDSLLEVSRIEAGETRFEMGPLDLKPIIEDQVQRTSILANKGVQVLTEIDLDLPQVTADREKIERVLVNLLDNALKYTPPDGHILVTATRREDELWISVTDSGPGIPPEERERVFERFTQGAGEKLKRRGFGLGLAYCRLAVERHGGRIWAEAGEDHLGSRFIFTLPIRH